MSDEFGPDAIDVDFERGSLDNIYLKQHINPERYEQIRREIDFGDLVADLTGKTGSEIRCPFHGADTTPSFYIYPPARGNNGWCFGCVKGQQYYDHIRFVRELLGYSFIKALTYLEETYKLPFIPDVVEEDVEEDESDEVIITVEHADLVEPYINAARREIQANKDIEQAQEYLSIFFQADKLITDAKALNESKDIEDAEERHAEVTRIRTLAALKLARVLGPEVIDQVAGSK